MGDPLEVKDRFFLESNFENILQRSRKPGKLETYVGTEFKNKTFQIFLILQNVHYFEKKERVFILHLFSTSGIMRLITTCNGYMTLSVFCSSPAGRPSLKPPFLSGKGFRPLW